jgi:tetratricopeptide (TPR) repeat protein
MVLARTLAMLGLAALLTVTTHDASAQGDQPMTKELDAARALANAGLAFYESGDYTAALERLRNAEAIYHAPPHLLYIARCLDKLGRLVEARDTYQRVADEPVDPAAPPQFAKAKEAATEELPRVAARIARLTVVVDGATDDLTLRIDEAELSNDRFGTPIEVDPGEHQVTVLRPGAEPSIEVVTIVEGADETVQLGAPSSPAGSTDAGDSPSTSEGPSLVGPAVLLGVGGAGLLLGAVMGGLALDKRQKLDEACPDPTSCASENRALEDDGRTFGHVSTAGFVVGGAAAAGGIAWLIYVLSQDDPGEPGVAFWSSAETLGLQLRF